MILLMLRLIAAITIAFLVGKLVSKIKLPAILGWLLTGMILSPHAIGLVNGALLDSQWYHSIVTFLECTVGLLIGTELVFKKIKKSGKQIIVTTLTQSLGTFFIVTLVFAIVFYLIKVPLYLAVILGVSLLQQPLPLHSLL